MKLLQHEKRSPPAPCHYIAGKYWRFRYFFATDLSEEDLGTYLSKGWRKFGYYYFRPDCDDCDKCTPIRISVNGFKPSKSHKRVISKNKSIRIELDRLIYSDNIFELYKKHSSVRFNQYDTDKNDFMSSFFTQSCPTYLSKYYLEHRLIGTGFLDKCNSGLSSVYFIFDTDYSNLSPGTYSILAEINHAAYLKLSYYYLGYYIEECTSMTYKDRFHPYELYNWNKKEWITPQGKRM